MKPIVTLMVSKDNERKPFFVWTDGRQMEICMDKGNTTCPLNLLPPLKKAGEKKNQKVI